MALTIKLGSGRRKRNADSTLDGSCAASDGTIQGFYGCHIEKFMSEGESSHWYKVADLLWHGKHGHKQLLNFIFAIRNVNGQLNVCFVALYIC